MNRRVERAQWQRKHQVASALALAEVAARHGERGVGIGSECAPLCGLVELSVDRYPTWVRYAAAGEAGVLAALRALPSALVGVGVTRGLVLVDREPMGDGDERYTFDRRLAGGVPCECGVRVIRRSNGVLAQVRLRRTDGLATLSLEPRYTRGEARESALRQLVADDPEAARETDEAAPRLLVISAGERARLVHRFTIALGGLAHVVDVEDATLEVVQVRVDERGLRAL